MRNRSLRPAWAVGITSCALAALGGPAAAQEGSIVDVAARAGSFETLLTAAKAAGLATVLAGDGPFTVFAPTDDAFAALPGGAIEALVRDPARLRAILTHHVVAGRLPASAVVGRTSVDTVAGTTLRVDARDAGGAGVFVGGARVVVADVAASNGVIHVIDRVLLPPAATSETGRASPTPGKHAGEQARFPRLEAESLERVRYTLPGGLTGERNLVLIAFQQWQQRECDSWLGWLEDGPLARLEGFAWWELPTIAPMGEAFQRWVDDGMRRGIADAAARGRTITLWTDKAAFKRALRIESERAITVALLDRDGNVLWRTTGRFTPEKGAALEAALRGHLPSSAPAGAGCAAQGL